MAARQPSVLAHAPAAAQDALRAQHWLEVQRLLKQKHAEQQVHKRPQSASAAPPPPPPPPPPRGGQQAEQQQQQQQQQQQR
ncbi:MAG: hypothetical protein ACK4ZJ_16790 [Allorhizobium sp.]